MPKQIIIAEQHRTAAVFSEDQIQELIVATGSYQVSDIYLGSVENVLPGIDAAFVNLGDNERNGFLHAADLGPLKLKRMAGSITELVAPNQKVLVQVMKEPTGNKGPRLTGKVTLPGRYLVLMPYGRGVNLSRRIRNEEERHRLRALGILIKPPGMGLLVRTEAEGVSEDGIIEDLESLKKSWDSIQEEAQTTRAPALLNRDNDFIQRVLRDAYTADVNRIVADSQAGMQRIKQQLSNWNEEDRVPSGVLVDQHRDSTPILEYFRVNAAIREALKPRVDLPSGGYIIIEPTEALTVIDVNSGSFTRSATARETVLWTNCEAAIEIARQLRLRNIAGVIVVDFIDMDSFRDKKHVLEQFERALKADKARPQISQLSELGLVELTRKRQGQNIYELFGRPCAACGGLGHVAQMPGEEPEALSLERSPVSHRASRSSRSSRNSSSSVSSPEPAYQNLQALDLLNHPDYQSGEKSNGRGGSRRRRRRGGSNGDTPPSRSSRNGGRDRDSNREPAREPSREPKAVDTSPVVETVPEPQEETSSKKRSRSRNRKPETPPEKIVVEMTTDQQRIYAEMGISPLVLSSNTPEDPKNTVITVVLPGEAATLETDNAAPDEAQANSTSSDAARPEKPKLVKKSDMAAADAPAAELDAADTATPEPETISEAEDSVEEKEPVAATPRRRRRRRSSAAS
ncbi:MAG: Rne/Rng family ribonuclease [Cyanobacteria bacterium J06632_22]